MDKQVSPEDIDSVVYDNPLVIETKKGKKRKNPDIDLTEKPKKKQKVESQELVEVDTDELNEEELNIRNMLSKELKQLLVDFPGLDIQSIALLDEQIKYLTTNEIAKQIDNIKLKIGLLHPYQNSKPIAGIMGLAISAKFDTPDIVEKMSEDKELLSALDHFFPSTQYFLTPLMKIVYRCSFHVSNAYAEAKARNIGIPQ